MCIRFADYIADRLGIVLAHEFGIRSQRDLGAGPLLTARRSEFLDFAEFKKVRRGLQRLERQLALVSTVGTKFECLAGHDSLPVMCLSARRASAVTCQWARRSLGERLAMMKTLCSPAAKVQRRWPPLVSSMATVAP
jgi:hypothetical protein